MTKERHVQRHRNIFIKLKKKRLIEDLFQTMEKISQNNKIKKKDII